jgi:hypothetical protein
MENPPLTVEQHRLLTVCQDFVGVVDRFSEEEFARQPNGKWSVADVMQHLYLSARPVARLMTGPREVLLQWEKAREPSRAYEEIADTYQLILSTGVKAPATMSPRPEDMPVDRSIIVERFTGVYRTLSEAVGHWSDEELDEYTIPHPVLELLTVREMLHFTSAHTLHHLRLLPII